MNAATGGPWFFVHLQKTGGTSLNLQLMQQFGRDALYPWPPDVPDDAERPQISVAALRRAWAERGDRIRMIAGHFPFATMELLGGGFTSLTILRDPVARTISNIRSQLGGNLRMEGLDPVEVYERTRPFTRNHMLRMLSVTAAEIIETEELGRWPVFRHVDPTDERLAAAKANLERIDVIGLTERLDEFTAELDARFGWHLGSAAHANASPPADLPAELIEQIRADHGPDLALYAHARELVTRRRASTGTGQ